MDVTKKRLKSSEVGNELDRISALPIHLRELILERLPIKDAMRTSILSSNWRYSWIGMVHFDLKEMALDESVDMALFRKTIDRILLLHTDPIHFIKFCFPQKGNYLEVNLSDWFMVLSKKGIRIIEADASSTQNQILLPHSLFQCDNLKNLRLVSFKVMPPPHFVGFNSLVFLVLENCTIPWNTLGRLISHCPLLAHLKLKSSCAKYHDQPLPMVVNAANLKFFFIYDRFFGTIIFQNVPRLRHAIFLTNNLADMDHERPCISWDFICSMPRIMKLYFQLPLVRPMIGRLTRFLPMRLENLTDLCLLDANTCITDDLRLMLCFLRSSPRLETLQIKLQNTKTVKVPVTEKSREEALKFLEAELHDNSKLSDLENIILFWSNREVTWLRNEIMLVKIMLSRCPNLKSLKITPVHSKETHTEDFIMLLSREIPNKYELVTIL